MDTHHQLSNTSPMPQPQINADAGGKSRSTGSSSGKGTKKRKRNQDLGPGAPRQPVNGYVRFLNERREQVRASNPSAGFADIMKIMAQEWTQLPAEEKQKYMQAAEQDRQRYQKELQEYQQTEAYKNYVQQQQQQHVQQQLHLSQQQRPPMPNQPPHAQQQQQQQPPHPQQQQPPQQHQQHLPPPPHSSHAHMHAMYGQHIQSYNPQLHMNQHMHPGMPPQQPDRANNVAMHRPDMPGSQTGVFDIPIFTEEFLDHNKVRESELRQLRKASAEYEEQNSALRKHVETLQAAVNRLEAETEQQRRHSAALQHHLDSLRDVLANSFAHLPLPGYNETPTSHTVDGYMAHLRSIIQEGAPENAEIIAAARDIISRLNYSA